jgi:prepilin-type N-terminal cleavage/methylation domain-containing protein
MEKIKWIDSKGFTLIEVMAVIAIVGILTGMGTDRLNRYYEVAMLYRFNFSDLVVGWKGGYFPNKS